MPLSGDPALKTPAAEVEAIIANCRVRTEFQPIIALRDGTVMGFEALSRGPLGTPFAEPRFLFGAAWSAGLLSALERVCWSKNLESAAQCFRGRKGFTNLFVNVMPEEIRQPDFLSYTLEIARQSEILPNQIVVEITEGSRIDDYSLFRRILTSYRAVGLRVAVDDAGAGHSGLQTIVELNPDFVKVDRTLVSGVDQCAGKRAAVEALALVARRLGLGLIAEGIETVDELMEVRRLGVPYAQGYLLGRPTDVPGNVPDELRVLLLPSAPVPVERQRRSAGLFVGDIVAPSPTVVTGTRIEQVFDRFEQERTDGFVVVDGVVPRGIVMRPTLYRLLSQRYGHELYLRKPIDEVATRPLVVDARVQVEDVSRRATERQEDTLYDSIVVTRDDAYLGTVSVQRLLEAITSLRLASARMENPLTGLPGNPAIEEELVKRLAAGLTAALVYADLDNFKAFNDHYGFHHGDRAIKIAAQVLTRVVGEQGGVASFLGHIGGDDFFAICDRDQVTAVCEDARVQFERQAWQLYDESERAQGYFETTGRTGELARYPLLSMTLAAIPVSDPGADVSALLTSLTAAKNRAKGSRARTEVMLPRPPVSLVRA